uniref:Uncharacterized protein n=1 Tax=Oryza meridionalis TaxID=40149 RepID=A0A0E0E3V0_9ORYZ
MSGMCKPVSPARWASCPGIADAAGKTRQEWQRVRASDSSRVSVSTPSPKGYAAPLRDMRGRAVKGERRDEKPRLRLPSCTHTRMSGSGVTQAHVRPGLSSSRWQQNSLRIPRNDYDL